MGGEMNSVRIRMYRQGLGDCFLVALPRVESVRPYYILIDCGVVLGTPGGAERMRAVAKDIVSATNGHIDLLIATHEHWDHVSGFLQAQDVFRGLTVDEIWLP